MDLGRIGLFFLISGVSIYYGFSQGRTSMVIFGIVIAVVGIMNAVKQIRKKKDDEQDK